MRAVTGAYNKQGSIATLDTVDRDLLHCLARLIEES